MVVMLKGRVADSLCGGHRLLKADVTGVIYRTVLDVIGRRSRIPTDKTPSLSGRRSGVVMTSLLQQVRPV